MRILSIAIGPESGSMWYRQIQPMQALARAGYPAAVVPYEGTPSSVINGYDVILFSRIGGAAAAQAVASIKRLQERGKVVFVDFDDDLLNVPQHNPAYTGKVDGIVEVMQAADGLVVTNEALAK